MIPIVVLCGLGATGLYGTVKSAMAAVDHLDAKKTNNDAQSIVDAARYRIEKRREVTGNVIEDFGARKLRAYNGTIADFIATFSMLKNVETNIGPQSESLQLDNSPDLILGGLKSDYQALQDAGIGLGAGIGGGAALAFGVYNGTMMLASASTGTAISSLGGAAATNATLAWLGGGSLAAGGGGMAMGMLVLGGLVTGPSLAVLGHIVGNKAEAAQADAYSNLESAKTFEENAKLVEQKLIAIQNVVVLANAVFSSTTTRLRKSVHMLKAVIEENGTDYSKYSQENRETVFRTVKLAQILKAMIDTPIMDNGGNLEVSTEGRFKELGNSARSTLLPPPEVVKATEERVISQEAPIKAPTG